MPRKRRSPAVTAATVVRIIIDFENLPEETISLTDLKTRRPWANKPERKNGGRANQNSQFNTAINKELNAGRALASALEHQHKMTFG